jgi:hypothetical protein
VLCQRESFEDGEALRDVEKGGSFRPAPPFDTVDGGPDAHANRLRMWSRGEDDDAATKFRRRANTWALTKKLKKATPPSRVRHICGESCRFYSAITLLFYSFCILVVLTIFNVVFLSKLKYLSCTFAKPWKFVFPKI